MLDTGAEKRAFWAAGVVSGAGLLSTGLHLWHGVQEISTNLVATVSGSLLPLVAAAFLVESGHWIANRDWTYTSPWRVVAWCVGGVVVGTVFILFLFQYQVAEGNTLTHQGFVIAMFATYGAALGALLGRGEARRRAQQAQLERKTQRLDEFATIVTHDLRNPLGIAQGYVDLARETDDLSRLEPADEALDRMESIIAGTLTLARQGTEGMTTETVDLAQAATEAWSVIGTDGAELQIAGNQRLQANSDRFKALLENLFRNSVEHNDDPVTVRVGPLESARGFYVEDTGVGISEELREEAFEPGVTTSEEGAGIGFKIVRAAADAHGWSLNLAESDAGGVRVEVTETATTSEPAALPSPGSRLVAGLRRYTSGR